MSTPDQPESPSLTRRQLREIRNTGTTPVQTPDDIARSGASAQEDDPFTPPVESEGALTEFDSVPAEPDGTPEESDAASAETVGFEPKERAAVPESQPDAEQTVSDPGVAPLTRRQAREHERIRTASVPIITPDAEPALVASDAAEPIHVPVNERAFAVHGETSADVIAEVPRAVRSSTVADGSEPVAIVNPHFGSGLLAGETPVVELPPSFDQLIARNGASGVSSSTPNALILSQTPAVAPLVAPVTATGEVLITGTFDLPEGLGSVGHAPGIHDGKETDAVLIDGELPAASSPTPIAASAAISQVRNNDEIIRPPAPEKGGRLVLALTLTAGALLVTVAGLLVLAFTTGIF